MTSRISQPSSQTVVDHRAERTLEGLRCLVLGGSGFIGTHLCRTLAKHGVKVRSFAAQPPPGDSDFDSVSGQIEWLVGDFDDTNMVRKAMRNIEVIFHLISTSLPATSNESIQSDLASNVLPTLQMLEAARSLGVRKVVFFSSGGAIYGIPNTVPILEDHPLEPICAYGIHKLAIEKYLHLFQHLWSLDYSVLRPSNPYGPGQPVNRPQGAIAQFMHRIVKHEPIEIWGDGSVVRDYIYIDDLIRACLKIIGHQGPSHVFNIGTGEGHSLLQLIGILEDIVGEKAEVRFRHARSADVPVNVLDVTRARTELGWHPSIGLHAGIRRLFEHTRFLPVTA